LARAARDVLPGADPPVNLTQRAKRILAEVRDERLPAVHPGGTVISRAGEDVRWWTWAGYRANATLAATLSSLVGTVPLAVALQPLPVVRRVRDQPGQQPETVRGLPPLRRLPPPPPGRTARHGQRGRASGPPVCSSNACCAGKIPGLGVRGGT